MMLRVQKFRATQKKESTQSPSRTLLLVKTETLVCSSQVKWGDLTVLPTDLLLVRFLENYLSSTLKTI